MKIHFLKTWPKYFSSVKSGFKTFEVRKNDRDYSEDDLVVLRMYDPGVEDYLGPYLTFKVGFILKEGFGLQDGYCAFSLLPGPVYLDNFIYDLNSGKCIVCGADTMHGFKPHKEDCEYNLMVSQEEFVDAEAWF